MHAGGTGQRQGGDECHGGEDEVKDWEAVVTKKKHTESAWWKHASAYESSDIRQWALTVTNRAFW